MSSSLEVKTVNAEVIDGRENNQRPTGSYTYDLDNPTIIGIIHQMAKRGLNKTEIAARIGISYRQFKRRCNFNAELNAAIVNGWGLLLDEMEKKEVELARSGNAFLLPRVIDRLRDIMQSDEESELRDVESSKEGRRGTGPVTRDELVAAIKADPFMKIEGIKDEERKANKSNRKGNGQGRKKAKKKTSRKKKSTEPAGPEKPLGQRNREEGEIKWLKSLNIKA